jgi:hypothetical protein
MNLCEVFSARSRNTGSRSVNRAGDYLRAPFTADIFDLIVIENLFCQPVIVLGMHRSGTSMLAGLLHSSGMFMGNDWGRNQESVFFQALNIGLLRQNGFNWASPGVPTNCGRIRIGGYGLIRRFVKAHRHPFQFAKLLGGNPWGWKDPRNTFTLGCWLNNFPRAKVIHIYRNGLDVALSLHQRNRKLGPENKCYEKSLESKTAGLDLWEKYVAQAFSYESLLADRMLTLQFEKIISCDKEEIEKLETFTGLSVRSKLVSTADQSRTARYKEGEHEDLIRYAAQNQWMKKLGYC